MTPAHKPDKQEAKTELRRRIVRSLSIAQIHEPGVQGEAIIEREADELLGAITTALNTAYEELLEHRVELIVPGHTLVDTGTGGKVHNTISVVPASIIEAKIRKETEVSDERRKS